MRAPENGAVTDGDVLEVAARFGPQLDVVARAGDVAIGHRKMLGGPGLTERQAGLGADSVVVGVNERVGNPHVAAAVRIDAIGIAVENRHPVHIDVIAAQKADCVVRGIPHRDAADRDVLDVLERNRLRPAAFFAVAVDHALAVHGYFLDVFSREQGVMEVGCLLVGVRGIIQLLVRIEIVVVGARENRGARGEVKSDAALEMNRPT